MDEDAHCYSPRYYFLSICQCSGFCIMKLMTCLLTEVRLFFCGERVCHGGRLCPCSFTCISGCLHACLFGVNESVCVRRVLRWPEDLGLELPLPRPTPGILQSIIDTPHLPSPFPPLCLTPLPQHANTLKGISGFHGGHER